MLNVRSSGELQRQPDEAVGEQACGLPDTRLLGQTDRRVAVEDGVDDS